MEIGIILLIDTGTLGNTNLEKYDNSRNSEQSKPTNSVRGPVVVRVAIARTSASSNNNPNIERIIVTKAKLTMNNIKKIHAIKTEISKEQPTHITNYY